MNPLICDCDIFLMSFFFFVCSYALFWCAAGLLLTTRLHYHQVLCDQASGEGDSLYSCLLPKVLPHCIPTPNIVRSIFPSFFFFFLNFSLSLFCQTANLSTSLSAKKNNQSFPSSCLIYYLCLSLQRGIKQKKFTEHINFFPINEN